MTTATTIGDSTEGYYLEIPPSKVNVPIPVPVLTAPETFTVVFTIRYTVPLTDYSALFLPKENRTFDMKVRVIRSWFPEGADRFYSAVFYNLFNEVPITGNSGFFLFEINNASVTLYYDNFNEPVTIPPNPQSNTAGTLVFDVGINNIPTGPPNFSVISYYGLFINLQNNSFLDGSIYLPFGIVLTNLDKLTNFYQGYNNNVDDNPIEESIPDVLFPITFPLAKYPLNDIIEKIQFSSL
jgi:hypothetical protein